MNTTKATVFFLLFTLFGKLCLASCNITISQTLVNSWTDSQYNNRQYSLTITNIGSEAVDSTTVDIVLPLYSLFTQYWAMEKTCCEQESSVITVDIPLYYLASGASYNAPGFIMRITEGENPSNPEYLIASTSC